MPELHGILFNMVGYYSFFLGMYAAFFAARNQSISGNFWGSVGVFMALSTITALVGVILALSGATTIDGRLTTYFLYMAWLVVIMPGLFSLLRGRDDRNASIAFAVLAVFNASVALSMFQRGLVTWVYPAI